MKNYRPSPSDSWSGRSTSIYEPTAYWYQLIECIDLSTVKTPEATVALIGYACDEGVKRNQEELERQTVPLPSAPASAKWLIT